MTGMTATVKDATFDVLRAHDLTTVFANPGSTEVPFLAGLPSDFEFVLGLHEAAVVGTATGYAIATGRPALVLLHTTAGYGNAVNAIATARVNRVPLVVLVGQQDRRHLRHDPFLAGRLDGLAGEYPVWQGQPPRPQDVPSYVARAWQEARSGHGPAVVVVPMDDWGQPADLTTEPAAPAGPHAVRHATYLPESDLDDLAALVAAATAPVLVAGAGNTTDRGWHALVELADLLGCQVWQEPFGARAGFSQDHARFAGHLPAGRAGLRDALAGHDLVLVVGAPAFRQYPYEPGRLLPDGARLVVVAAEAEEAHRSPADLCLVAPPETVLSGLVERLSRSTPVAGGEARPDVSAARLWPEPSAPPQTPAQPADDAPISPRALLAELACRLPAAAVVVEETPSSRADLHELLPARNPLGFVSAAMGGLGFGLPAVVGLKLALPDRPVVAVLGDGSSLYAVQALWTAARYGAGVVFVVLSNGRYAIMDRLNAAATAADSPWPGFGDISLSTLARGLGCPAVRVENHGELRAALDAELEGLTRRTRPVLLDVAVSVPGAATTLDLTTRNLIVKDAAVASATHTAQEES